MVVPLLTLAPLLAVGVLTVLVWSGRWSRWFERPGAIGLLVWPVPALVVLLTPAILWTERGLAAAGWEPGLAVVAGGWLLVGATVGLRPPRWAFPAWVRLRVARLPRSADRPNAVGCPAVRCLDPPRFGSAGSRWTLLIDGQPGWLVADDGGLRFEPIVPDVPVSSWAPLTYTIDDPEVPGDGVLDRWELPDGRELRAYSAPAAAAVAHRWQLAADDLVGVDHRPWHGRRGRRVVTVHTRSGDAVRFVVDGDATCLATVAPRAR
jgi:hypothetical protein